MACIVGAACQPLQPADLPAGRAATETSLRSGQDDVGRDDAGPDEERWDVSVGTPGNQVGGPLVRSGTTFPSNEAPLIALLVPLSGQQEALGIAIRDGFIAGWLDAPDSRRFRTMIIDEARVSASEAYGRALDAGAQALVGPLLKDSVQAMASVAGPLPVLALNNLADSSPGMRGPLWQFGLAPEDEARAIASRALALGQRRAIVLLPANDWGRRLLAAFTDEFTRGGGVLVDTRTYLPGAADFTTPIRSLLMTTEPRPTGPRTATNPGEKPSLGPGRRRDVDLIFLAATSRNGRQIVPQLKFFGAADLPTYSTSSIWDDGSSNADDLNGVVFPDSPWVIDPDSRARLVKDGLVRHWGRPVLGVSRFYALGYDAFQLLPSILSHAAPGPLAGGEIRGTTGVLYADMGGRIHRRLSFAEIRNGRSVALPAVTPLTLPISDPPTTLSPGPEGGI